MKRKVLMWTVVFLLNAGMAFGSHSGTITYKIHLNVEDNAKAANLWRPYPLSDGYQKIKDVKIDGNYERSGVYRDPDSEAVFFSAGWSKLSEKPSVVMRFHVDLKDRKIKEIKDSNDPIPAPIRKYTEASQWVPAADKDIKEIAYKATAGKKGILEKAQGVYDWVVENTYRDPSVKGCGLGIPGRTVLQCKGGGKCADISSVYVAVARAAGVPARDVFGLRLSNPKDGDITSGFHCWAEFFLPGSGWISVDPADVRKMMLVHNVDLKDAGKWRKFFWGGDDLFRVVLEKNSRGVVFDPPQQGKPVNYFMYPYAQVDGKTLNFFDPKGFTYTVSYKAD
jgi:transglutaminase-like putative cysteine protease